MPESPVAPVYLADCETYDTAAITALLRDAFAALGITREEIAGKKVALKPNLVLGKKPDLAATTHPAIVSACADVIHEMGAASITLAESPGGPFNASSLSHVYRTCEMSPLASDTLKLNDDYTWVDAKTDGEKLKSFHIIRAIEEADVIIDLCKLKSHGLTGLSGAVKNFFGVIPGVEKVEMHSTFPQIEDFSEMLVDLASYLRNRKPMIVICDAVLSMEGNGPTYGSPKHTGLLLASRSPFTLDVIAEHIMRFDGEILHLNAAARRGLTPRDWTQVPLLVGEGSRRTECPTFDFRRPDSDSGKLLKSLPTLFGGRIARFLEARPEITKACVGCGKCAASCPRKTITLVDKKGKRRAQIHRENCIRCYCCQELCPIGAVGTHQNPIIKFLH